MPAAKSLKDLIQIRAQKKNRDYLDSINGTLGTALGFKRRTGEPLSTEPAIIVFVPEKIHRKWLPAGQLIRSHLTGPNRLKCPLDVVAGGRAVHEEPIPHSGTALAQRLRGWDEKIWCGSQISSASGGSVSVGTLGIFVERRSDGAQGFLTNHHVAVNVTLWHPWAPGSPNFAAGTKLIARRDVTIIEKPLDEWYGKFAKERGNPNAAVRVDAALCLLEPQLKPDDLSPRPLIDQAVSGGLPDVPVGSPLEIDLEADMSDAESRIIGEEVFHVGRTTGLRKGQIAAFAYEWQDQPGQTRYTDLLIAGERRRLATGVELSVPFSYKGDSGTVIFTHKQGKQRPVALLWGGFQEQLRGGESQENWSYATRVDKLLDELDLAILTTV